MDAGAAAGPTEAFLKEFASQHDRLFAYLFSLLPHRPDAEDVFQRTSLVLWQKFDQWEPGSDFLAWACSVAFYEARNFIRVASRDRLRFGEALLESLAKERAASLRRRDDRVAALQECLKKLDHAERELLQRAYVDQESIRELARRDGQAAQTLYNRLNLIRKRLLLCVDLRSAARGEPA
ncbi:MAG TPA: sigma-70 family RNA polymerase sigma factor [Planctomycetota bacterium]|jgi:RNA polymerase sigma-70 factor (ECF subfamily)|nr:sigma-70 family RNA polymerase sigma factor [Planctomycetota bacterium]